MSMTQRLLNIGSSNLPHLTGDRFTCNLSINFTLRFPQGLHKFTKTVFPQNENGKNFNNKIFELNLESLIKGSQISQNAKRWLIGWGFMRIQYDIEIFHTIPSLSKKSDQVTQQANRIEKKPMTIQEMYPMRRTGRERLIY